MAHGKTKAIVAIGFAAALVGGGAAGMLASRYVHPPNNKVSVAVEASLSTELQLTKEQQSQIRQIWEQVRDLNQSAYNDGEALNQWRNDQIVKLLNPEQLKDFQKINSEYQDRYTAMTANRQLAFDQAVAKTKKLLSNEQRQRYEQILEKRMGTGFESQPSSTRPAPTFSASSVSREVVSPG